MTASTNSGEPTTIEKMRGLRWNTLADAANTFFVQFTFFGSVFILFLSELGLSKSFIGFMLSLFPFAGLIAPFIAPAVARVGYKRTFLTFWGLRKLITALLLLVPLVIARAGSDAAFIFVTAITAGFALCRAIAETGKYPWTQEYVPNHVRGKYAAITNASTTVTGLIAVAVAGLVLDRSAGLTGYIWLIGIGIFFGLLGFWAYSFIPGGAPTAVRGQKQPRALRSALANSGFRSYLIGIALMTLAVTPMTSFLPLFMREQVGLSDSQVVLLQNGVLIGGLLSVYVWGWAADRFGSSPVMLWGILTRLILPVLWMLMPRFNPYSLTVALLIALLQGVAGMGWLIGSGRMLFVSVVPPQQKADYMALYYAWIGVVGGFSQLAGGWILQWSENLDGQLLRIPLDPYTPLFLLGLGLPVVSLIVLRRIHVANEVGVGQFAGLFLRGHPFMAVESMIRFHLARDEQAAVLSTEKLGQAKSPLTVDELLESLQDPRFNVRFEAIVAIGRGRVDPRLIAGLAEVLRGRDPALSVMAAWALGRLGAPDGQPPLRHALDAGYRSIRAHSARSLATLGDNSIADVLWRRLQEEQDHGLKVAYAAALGQLQVKKAVPHILPLLYQETEPMARAELALALARVSGDENRYMTLLRRLRGDPDTAVSQLLLNLPPKRLADPQAAAALAITFSRADYDTGISGLVSLVQEQLQQPLPAGQQQILQECVRRLPEFGTRREEYLLLTCHLLQESLQT